MTKAVKSPLRYPGGKSRAVKSILELIPPDLDRLCSPFIGGGSVELALVGKGVKVYGYDAFEPLVNFWQEVLKDAQGLADDVRSYYPLTCSKFNALQKRCLSLKNKRLMAAVFYVLNRTSFSGTTLSGGMSKNHPRFTDSAIKRLANFTAKTLSVQYADFSVSIEAHKDIFLYLDPPYANDEKLYGFQGELSSNFDHEKLAEKIKGRDGWLLSYNNCDMVKDLYSGYKFYYPSWSYGINYKNPFSEILILSKNERAIK